MNHSIKLCCNSKTDTRTKTFYNTIYLKGCGKQSQKAAFGSMRHLTPRNLPVPKRDHQETVQITSTSKGNNSKQLKRY